MFNKIEGFATVVTPRPVRSPIKGSASGKSDFSSHLTETAATDESAPTASTNAATAINAMLGTQEVDDAVNREARGKLRAKDLLDKLDDLRMQVLIGGLSREKLLRLAQDVNARRTENYAPQLTDLLDEIDLRVRVEIAKYSPHGG